MSVMPSSCALRRNLPTPGLFMKGVVPGTPLSFNVRAIGRGRRAGLAAISAICRLTDAPSAFARLEVRVNAATPLERGMAGGSTGASMLSLIHI
eukprot:3737085-Alexandrium_andersonii.AAC.1